MTKILKTVAEVRNFRQTLGNQRLGLVPTMGNLHDGHLSLMQLAQNQANVVMASIFVNPTQFGENEDLDAYPRTFETDLEKLQTIGVDAVFFPNEKTIYPHGKDNTLSIEMPKNMTHILCGIDRPAHFQGVATVVAKLFAIVTPDIAVFGEKDFQQLALIRRLNDELFLGIDIYGGPIVREPNGLAMSSRNQYLDAKQRKQATWLSKTLSESRQRLLAGEKPETVLTKGITQLREHGAKAEYLDLRDKNTLLPSTASEIDNAILLVAARFGHTRLIDNLQVSY